MRPKGKRTAIAAGALALVILALAAWRSWPHLRFWWLFEPLGPNAQGYPEYRHRQTGIVFVSLPGGKFWMGAQDKDPGAQNYDPGAMSFEGPVHEVTLSPFLVAKFEVTQSEWERTMGPHGSGTQGSDLPVDHVSWEQCKLFCARTRLGLPTEAQWEYACRARTVTPYSGTGRLDDMGWYDGNSGQGTGTAGIHAVGQKAPNRFGLHDLHGNASEWCQDVYGESFYSRSPDKDPVCTSGLMGRVVRGGEWGLPPRYARSSARHAARESFQSDTGFRPTYPLP